MGSQNPAAPAPPAEVKEEDQNEEITVSESNATEPTLSSAPAHTPNPADGLSKHDLEVMTKLVSLLTDYRNDEGNDISSGFQRMLSRRQLPDYFDIIKEPIAFSTIRSKISKKQYKAFKEFVRDLALIYHNAQVYNRPSAPIYGDALALREVTRAELQRLVDDKTVAAEDIEFPDLGEIPEVEDSPPPGPEEEEPEEEEDEDDEDEEDDETDDDRPRRRGKKNRRSSAAAKRDGKAEDGSKEDPEAQKKRGRPPKVHTPMEARINTLLKGLRKFKNPGGDLKILHFEKLPDKSVMPEYYQEIKNPIAMDLIKRKAKRKKYQSVDQALKDLELMFENAKGYNLEDSLVYRDAVDLQREARILAEQEKKKPDSDFVDEDGRLPVPEILYNGELWKVGDWVHLSNTNDVTKPIVAQVYRTWQDPAGQKWINACWYYRPEQTVHSVEKHFFENEVVKTGQYRDHKIEEVVDRCFVMFFTRYNKGRPRGFPADKEVYVCEARYNEEKHKLNKIKTWASCVPDEVREKDYEMDLYDAPRKMKKVPSPIKHLLREDAKEDDPLPKPTWGQPNAPPIVGAVHRRPRDSNESPPPEETPPPQPSPEPVRRPATSDRSRYDSQADVTMSGTSNPPPPSPLPNQNAGQASYGQQFAPSRPSQSPAPMVHQNSYGSHTSTTPAPPTPHFQSQTAYNSYTPAATPSNQHSNHLTAYNQYQNTHTAPRPTVPATVSYSGQTNAYNPPRPSEVYTLPDVANASIPADIRAQFQHDEYGKVLFFTAPPLDVNPLLDETQGLSHSLRYLADKARTQIEDDKKRTAYQASLEAAAGDRLKRMKADAIGNKKWIVDQKLSHLNAWVEGMDKGTDELYRKMHGENWKEIRQSDLKNLVSQQIKAIELEQEIAAFHVARKSGKEVKITGFSWI